jgi:hsp70-interacting protein
MVGPSSVMLCKVSSTLTYSGIERMTDEAFPPSDPEITVRRKTIFLLSALLLPTGPISSSTVSHPGFHAPSSASPDQHNEPVYDNSHAAQLSDPSRAVTSDLTIDAVQRHGILDTVISGLADPIPFGEDGDSSEADPTFEEQSLRYATSLDW